MFENLYKYSKNNSIDIIRSNYYFYWWRKKIKGNKFELLENYIIKYLIQSPIQMFFLLLPQYGQQFIKKI